MMRKTVYSDILPHFEVTSCLARRDILRGLGRNILPSHLRDILPHFRNNRFPGEKSKCEE